MKMPSLLKSISRVGLAVSLAGTVLLSAPTTTAADSASATPSDSLNEVIVTAQRREQRLQDVGISVTAMGAEDLKALNIENASDIARAVPSLKLNAFSSSAVVWNIRGVSQNDYGDQQEPPVAVYQDDSYSSSINTASFPTFDLARIEVLRGPQGTLFGRNATGGAIQFISNKPTKTLDGYASLSVGSNNQRIYEGAISGPLSDNVQARFSAIRDTDDGFITDVTPGSQKFGGANHYALRGIIEWQPAEGTNVGLTLRYMRAPNERQAGGYVFQPACPNDNYQGAVLPANQGCGFWGSNPLSSGSNYRNDAININLGANPWTTAAGDKAMANRQILGSTLRVDTQFGDTAFTSITDFQHSTKNYLEDGDSGPGVDVQFFLSNSVKQYSQEFRLARTMGPHEVSGGVFGMRNNGSYDGGFPIYFIGYVPSVQYSQDTKSWAVFAQDEWTLNNQFKLITGLRYWHDERLGSYYGHAPTNGLDPLDPLYQPPVTIIFNPREVSSSAPGDSLADLKVTPADADKTYTGVTGRLELDYKPSDDLLLYASYNRGGKSGGFTFSTGTPFHPSEVPFLNGIPYRPEVLTAYETGIKATINRTTSINASLFHYNYKDYQAFAQVGVVQSVLNLDAKSNGLEIELNSRPMSGLTVKVGTSFLNTRVYNILLPGYAYTGIPVYQDHDLPQTPKFSGNALARYEYSLGNGVASVQADVTYSGGFCFTVLCAPVEKEGSYSVANVRVGYEPTGGHWEFSAYGTNIGNSAYRVYAFDSSQFAGLALGIYGKPRLWGANVTYHFGAARN